MQLSSDPRTRAMFASFFVNLSLVFVKLITGILSGSVGLVADAFHSLSDFMSDVLVIFGIRQGRKPPDAGHPIGHGKIEYVLSLLLGVGILFIAYQLISNALPTFGQPPSAPHAAAILVIAVVLTAKFVLSRYLLKKSVELDSQVLKASGQESYMEMFGTFAVLIGVALGLIGQRTGMEWLMFADNVAALVIALFIVRVAFFVIREAVDFVLGKSASQATIEATRRLIQPIEGVEGVDRLTMIDYGHYYQVMVEIRVDGSLSVREGHAIAHRVRDRLKSEPNLNHVEVHVNPEVKT